MAAILNQLTGLPDGALAPSSNQRTLLIRNGRHQTIVALEDNSSRSDRLPQTEKEAVEAQARAVIAKRVILIRSSTTCQFVEIEIAD